MNAYIYLTVHGTRLAINPSMITGWSELKPTNGCRLKFSDFGQQRDIEVDQSFDEIKDLINGI